MKRKWLYGCLVTAAVLLMAGCGAEQAAVMPNPAPALQQESSVVSNVQKESVQAQAQAQPQEQPVVPVATQAPVQSQAQPQVQSQVQAPAQTQSQVPVKPQTQASVQSQVQVQPQVQVPVQPQTPVYGGYHHGRNGGHHGRGHHAYQASANCNQCYGSGQCPTCSGSGYYHNQVCPTCTSRHGSCGFCNGTGRIL